MAPFYGWGSTASRLQPLQGGSLLLSKLEHYGIRGIALNLFQKYLKNQTQFVEIKKKVSYTHNILWYPTRISSCSTTVPYLY